jgi:hypothetical protein
MTTQKTANKTDAARSCAVAMRDYLVTHTTRNALPPAMLFGVPRLRTDSRCFPTRAQLGLTSTDADGLI